MDAGFAVGSPRLLHTQVLIAIEHFPSAHTGVGWLDAVEAATVEAIVACFTGQGIGRLHVIAGGIPVGLAAAAIQIPLQVFHLDGGRAELIGGFQYPHLVVLEAIGDASPQGGAGAVDGVFGGAPYTQAAVEAAGVVGGVLDTAGGVVGTEVEYISFGVEGGDHSSRDKGVFVAAADFVFIALLAEDPGAGVGQIPRGAADLQTEAVFLVLGPRSEEHTSELQSRPHLVCRLLLEKKKK